MLFRSRLSDLKRGYKGREDEKPFIGRLALHASALAFTHPATRERVTLTAPVPHEFEVALKYLRRFAARPGPELAHRAGPVSSSSTVSSP